MKAEINQLIEYFDNCPETKYKLPWERIPVEIWVKIFGYFKHLISLQQKPVTRLRLVCKLWRDVIDENLDFDIKLSDTVLNWDSFRHLRVRHLSAQNLKKSVTLKKLMFRDFTTITSMSLSNKITRENFVILIGNFPNVKRLKINASFLSSEIDLFVPASSSEESIFNRFWKSNKELDFNYDCTDAAIAKYWTNNFTRLMETEMANLQVFIFNAPLRFIESQLPITFLLQNPSIRDIDFRFCAECNHKYLLPNLQTVKKIKIYDFKRIQLRSIKLKAIRLYEYGYQAWLPIIKAQQSLVNLAISQYGSSFLSGNFVSFDELSEMILANHSTLTSLKLENFHFPDYFDANIFRNHSKLRSLSLHLPQNDSCKPISCMRNLDLLPASLEKLLLQNVSINKEELQKILSVNYMKNLKYFRLLGVEDSLVISELVKALGEKKSLQILTMCPVVLDYFRLLPVDKGKHYCVVVDNNQRPVGKYFWVSRRLEFNCSGLRQTL